MALVLSGDGTISGANLNIDSDGAATFAGLTVDTNTLHVDATNNRVGIGTSSPSNSLSVNGSVQITNRTTSHALKTPDWQIYNATSNSLVFNNYSNDVMSINSVGHLTTPYQPMFCGRAYTADGNSPASGYLAFRWATLELNQGNYFNNTTGIFTTPVAGKYEMRFHFNRRAVHNNWHAAFIFVNGVARAGSWFPPSSETNYTYAPLSVGVILPLGANDQIAFAYSTSYSAPSTDATGNTASIALIG